MGTDWGLEAMKLLKEYLSHRDMWLQSRWSFGQPCRFCKGGVSLWDNDEYYSEHHEDNCLSVRAKALFDALPQE